MLNHPNRLFAIALTTLIGGATLAQAQVQIHQGNKLPTGVKILPQITGGPFPGTQPRFPIQPTFPIPTPCNFREIDRLAGRLEREASRLHDVVDDRHRRTNTYRQLHAEVQNLEAQADRIHFLADRRANPALIHQQVQQVEQSIRRVDRLIDDLARFQQVDRFTISQLRRRLENVHDLAEDLHRELHLNVR